MSNEQTEQPGAPASAASTNGGPANRRPKVEEMTRRRERVLALFEANPELTFDLEGLGEALELTGTQPQTLANKLLKSGDIVIVGHEGKKRIFGRGDGKPAPVTRIDPVPYAKLLSQLAVGDTVKVVGLNLDVNDPDERPLISLRTTKGRVVQLSAA